MGSEPIVEVRDLAVTYDGRTYVLDGLTFEIRRGEFVYLLGPNGGGKTTLFKVIIGLLKPSRGIVKIFGREVGRFDEWWRVGYLPQHVVQQLPAMPASVRELFDAFSIPGRAMDPMEVLSLVGLDEPDVMDMKISTLSGGQIQRVMIGVAIINRPELLLLDEPTVHVDVPGALNVIDLVRRMNSEMGTTVILATHDVSAIPPHSTRAICINRRSFFDGQLDELMGSEELCRIYGFHVNVLLHRHGWVEGE